MNLDCDKYELVNTKNYNYCLRQTDFNDETKLANTFSVLNGT